MFIRTRAKRNISFVLTIGGIMCIVARTLDVAQNPSSGKAWFELCGIILLTYMCFDNFNSYRKQLKNNTKD